MKTKAILCLILLSLCLVSYGADDSVDTSLDQSVEVVRFSDDSRLTQKITYSAKNLPLHKVVDEITDLTKITFRAGLNPGDWQVRDRKVSIFAKDTSFLAIMSSMERVLKMKWRRSGEAPDFAYRIIPDRKSILEAEKAWLADEQKMQIKRQEILSDYTNAANITPEEMEKIKEDNPMIYLAAKYGFAKPMADFFNANPNAANAVVYGQELTLSPDNLNQKSQNALSDAMTAFKIMPKIFRDRYNDEINGPFTVRINKYYPSMNFRMIPNIYLGDLIVTDASGKIAMNIQIFDPASKYTKYFGKVTIQSIEQNKSNDYSDSMMTQLFDASQALDKGEALIIHPEDRDLEKKISAKFEGESFADFQKILADASSFCLVSDSFGGTSEKLKIGVVKDKSIKELLNSLTESNRYNWDKHDNLIEFRSRDWYRNISAMIPDALIENLENKLKTTGILGIDDLVQISNLTVEQFTINFSDKKELWDALRLSSIGIANRNILRFYGTLNDIQKNQIFDFEVGLDLRKLSPQQISAFDYIKLERSIRGVNNIEESVLLRGAYQDKYYGFFLFAMDNSQINQWTLGLPQYVEKPKTDTDTTAKKPEEKP